MNNDIPIARPHYLKEALRFRDTDLLKVITGVRRCGKSTPLKTIWHTLGEEEAPKRVFVALDLESKV